MIEVRIHGRGGQGNVVAAYLLATTAINEGLHAQAFPAFGAERRGANASKSSKEYAGDSDNRNRGRSVQPAGSARSQPLFRLRKLSEP